MSENKSFREKIGLDYLIEPKKCPPHEFAREPYRLVGDYLYQLSPADIIANGISVRVCKLCRGVFALSAVSADSDG